MAMALVGRAGVPIFEPFLKLALRTDLIGRQPVAGRGRAG